MLIDFHVHCFPDNVAKNAIPKLAKTCGIENKNDGTIDGLLTSMKEYKIDHAVVLNIATNPKQMQNVNNFAIEINRAYSQLTALGSVHPESKDAISELKRIKEAGIKGIKIHPDYMGVNIDDELYDAIFSYCSDNDIFVIIHAGHDSISPNHLHASPKRILKTILKHPKLKLIAAHMGGYLNWDEVEKYLVGKNIWLDTSLACYDMTITQAKRIIENHNPEKILFGSDLPWCSSSQAFEYINMLDVSEETKQNIYWKNAKNILNI